MSDFILLLVVSFIVGLGVYKTYEPSIDITQTGANRYRVLLWYNYFEGPEIKRKWVRLFEYVKG